VTRLCLVRHAPTAWNAAGRLQGRADPPLSEAGRAEVGRWRLPGWAVAARAWTSPLERAVETARLLGLSESTVAPELIEMDWGAFEGRRLEDLRRADPLGLAALEARGLDLEPPGGESPRRVAERLAGFLARLGALGGDHLLLTHKGVVRAALALATGWDMRARPPLRLRGATALLLTLEPTGSVREPRPWPLTGPAA
jgi:probable phosphoglycerate mutase